MIDRRRETQEQELVRASPPALTMMAGAAMAQDMTIRCSLHPGAETGAVVTKTGYFWALAHDDRPWGGTAPPGVAFTFAPDRIGPDIQLAHC